MSDDGEEMASGIAFVSQLKRESVLTSSFQRIRKKRRKLIHSENSVPQSSTNKAVVIGPNLERGFVSGLILIIITTYLISSNLPTAVSSFRTM